MRDIKVTIMNIMVVVLFFMELFTFLMVAFLVYRSGNVADAVVEPTPVATVEPTVAPTEEATVEPSASPSASAKAKTTPKPTIDTSEE